MRNKSSKEKFFAILLIVNEMSFELDAILVWMACTWVFENIRQNLEHQTGKLIWKVHERSLKYLT